MFTTVLIICISFSTGFLLGSFWHAIMSTPFPPTPNNYGSPAPTFRTTRVPDSMPEEDLR